MIDTNKYEGHTPAPWDKLSEYCPVGSIDKQLIADAPLLLEEVKRLREELDEREAYIKKLHKQLVKATEWAYKQYCYKKEKMDDFDDYVWGEEE